MSMCLLGGRDVEVSVVARRSQRHQVPPGASVAGGHQPESAVNGTWALSTSSAHSEPLSHLSRSHRCWILNKNFHHNLNNDSGMYAIFYLSVAVLCVTQMVLTGGIKEPRYNLSSLFLFSHFFLGCGLCFYAFTENPVLPTYRNVKDWEVYLL